jgi:hypothetical protein
VVAASAALVALSLAGCGSGTDGRPLTAFEQIRLLEALDEARRAAAANEPERAREALGRFTQDVRGLAAYGALDEREAELLALGAERAEARVGAEAQPPRKERQPAESPPTRARKNRAPAEAQPPPTRKRKHTHKKRPPKPAARPDAESKRPDTVKEEREEEDD